jgi:acyl phosphate:glycerol-3-phosphate acyltransferase
MTGWLGALGLSYLVGSVPTAYLVVKRLKRIDIRTVGSGNVGATNVTRTAGKGAGIAVFAVDVSKGLIATLLIAPRLIDPSLPGARLACGLAAVVGHVFPVFLKFRGGKGVATTIGALIGFAPGLALLCGGVWAGIFLVSRYVSLASIVALATLPPALAAAHRSLAEILIGSALAGLVIAKHRSNIQRLVQGTEHRFSKSKP